MNENQVKPMSTKLQLDDPSIIHCRPIVKGDTVCQTSKKNKELNPKQDKVLTCNSKLASTKTLNERKSEPVNINPKKNRAKTAVHANSSHQNYNSSNWHRNSSKPPRHAGSLSSAKSTPVSGQKHPIEPKGKVEPKQSTSHPVYKTGTPIDNLIGVKSVASVDNAEIRTLPPRIPSQKIFTERKATKKTQPKFVKNPTAPVKTVTAVESSKSRKKIAEDEQRNKFSSRKQNVQSNKNKKPEKEDNIGLSNEAAKEADNVLKKKKRPISGKQRKNGTKQENLGNSTEAIITPDRSSIEKNKEAARNILNMVNGGVKATIKAESQPQMNASSHSSAKTQSKGKKTEAENPDKKELSPVKQTGKAGNPRLEKKEGKSSSSSEKLSPADPTTKPEAVQQHPVPRTQEPARLKQSREKVEKTTAESSSVLERIQDLAREAEKHENLALEQAGQRLKKDNVILLKKKPANFPNAKFFCKVCNYHLDGIPQAQRHVKEKRHRKNLKEFQQDEFLRSLTIPPEDALEEIEHLLSKKVLEGNILTNEDVATRASVVDKLNLMMSTDLPSCKAVMYGSSYSGFGFKNSDINVDLQHSDDISSPTALLQLLNLLISSDKCKNVQPDFHAKIPRVNFVDAESDLSVEISTGNDLAILTTRLLRFYAMLDERAVQLCMVFRTWARICKLDLQHDGALPPHSIPIMVIFFMQVRNYLPVLHEIISEWDMDEILSSSLSCAQLEWRNGSLWYFPTTPPEDSGGSTEESDGSDSESEGDVSFVLQETSIDFSHLSTHDVESDLANQSGTQGPSNSSAHPESKPSNLCDKCGNIDVNLANLFLDMLKFFALQFQIEDEIVHIRSSTRLKRGDKNWSKKRIAVIDPYLMKRNLCRSMNTQGVFTYFMSRMKGLLLYFFDRKPKRKQETKKAKRINGASPIRTSHVSESNRSKRSSTGQYSDDLATEDLVSNELFTSFGGLQVDDGASSTSHPLSPSVVKLSEDLIDGVLSRLKSVDVKNDDDEVFSNAAERLAEEATQQAFNEICSDVESTSEYAGDDMESSSLKMENSKYNYEFSFRVLTGGKLPVKVCGLCKKEGHPRKECPEEMRPKELAPLPPLTPVHIATLDRICQLMYEYYVPTRKEVIHRDEICQSLAAYLQQTYNSCTHMNLFGSSRNGFGFRGSDLDICMTFLGNPTGENLDSVMVIEEVAKQLRKNREFWNILPITTAKVPIVKFFHRESGLEGDISLYNLLAQRNTSMLRCYSVIDRRCKVLGYVMKAFVKLCSIGDASRGSLSSYAYTLMVIFYLQQKDVPVLPVLQELYDDSTKKPTLTVDGWNSWYYDDIDNLAKVWSGYKKNNESVGELWLGLLRFYTEEFNFRQFVICIRQKKPLTTFEKEWTSRFISIEDPFDLNHNLAAGVSHKMTQFISRVFIKAREHFGTIPKDEIPNEMNYYFNPGILMNGEEAPNDRCCRICGKIGHYVRDCPRNKRNKRGDGKGGSNNSEHCAVVCFYCSEQGHMKKDCPALKKAEEAMESESKENASSNHVDESASADQSRDAMPLDTHGSTGPAAGNADHQTDQMDSPDRSIVSRSQSEDAERRTSGSHSRRLFQRASESEVSNLVDRSPRAPTCGGVPDITSGIRNIPLTPPASLNYFLSSSPAPPLYPVYNSSPKKSTSDPLIPKPNQLSRSAPLLNHHMSPGSKFSRTAPLPVSPWPNSPVWGMSNHPPPSPHTMSSSNPADPKRFDPSIAHSPQSYMSPNHRQRQDFHALNQRNVYRGFPPTLAPFAYPVGLNPGANVGARLFFTPPANMESAHSESSELASTSPLRHQDGTRQGSASWGVGPHRKDM